jgi:hypothetical protein
MLAELGTRGRWDPRSEKYKAEPPSVSPYGLSRVYCSPLQCRDEAGQTVTKKEGCCNGEWPYPCSHNYLRNSRIGFAVLGVCYLDGAYLRVHTDVRLPIRGTDCIFCADTLPMQCRCKCGDGE